MTSRTDEEQAAAQTVALEPLTPTPPQPRISGGGSRRVTGGGVRQPTPAIGVGEVALTRQQPNVITDETRQQVSAAVAFHIGNRLPGIEWTAAVDPIADRFLTEFGSNPAMIRAIQEDVNALYALTDHDIADRLVNGRPLSQFGDVFDSIAEVAWEIGATDLAARIEADRADAISGTFEALTTGEAFTLAESTFEEGEPFPSDRFAPPTVRAQSFEVLFDVPGAWSFSPSTGVLAVTVGAETIGVHARPGFDPTNHLDVMAEVVAAQADGRIKGGALTGRQGEGAIEKVIGVAHDVGAWVDEHPGAQQFVDGLWTGLTGGDLDVARRQLRDRKGEITETSLRMASIIPFPEDATIAAIAREIMAEAGGLLGAGDALELAAEQVTENRDQFVAEFEGLTQERLIAQLEADIEGASPLGVAVEATVMDALEKMEAWDRFTQMVGVNVIDAVGDLLQAGEEFSRGDWVEGFEKFQAMLDSPEASTAAEYFDLEGAAADAANLAVGIGFDPLNLIFPGAKGIRWLAQRALTNIKYAPLYLKMGATRRVIEQIARDTGPKAVRNVGAMVNLENPEIIDLVKLALDPNATAAQVEAVFTRALAKDWLGDGPMRAIRLKTVEGVGRALESIAKASPKQLSPEAMDTVMKMVAKLSSKRSLRLGENQSLNDFADLITQFFPADKEKWAEWFLYAVNEQIAAGDQLALAGAAAMQKESARRAMWESGGTIRSIQGSQDIAAVGQNLRAIEDTLTRLDELGLDEASTRWATDQLTRMHAVMSRRVEEAAPGLTTAKEKLRQAHRQLNKARALEADQAANAARNNMGRVVAELYEEIAQRLNTQFGRDVIPVKTGKVNPLAPEIPVRDWSEVSLMGKRKTLTADDPDLALMMGLASDDVDLARQLDAVGLGRRTQHIPLPASPYEIILFEKLGHDRKLMSQITRQFRRDWMRTVGRTMRGMFGVNLLLNPISAARITLDPTLRFLAETGQVLKSVRAAGAGIPVVGRGTEQAVGGFRRLATSAVNSEDWFVEKFGAPLRRYASKHGESIVNPYGLQFSRNVQGWSADDFGRFDWVSRPPRRVGVGQMSLADYREVAERWVNGTLLQQPHFREYARWINEATVLEDGTKIPPKGWVDWWEQGTGAGRPGKADARPVKVTLREQTLLGTELTASDAFNILDRSFNLWLDAVVDDSARGLMRDRLLKAAVTPGFGLDVVRDARLLNAVQRVPGLSRDTGFGSQVFQTFFGAPAGRTAGVYYEHHFDEAMDILRTRHSERLLTVDRLIEFTGADRQTAEYWLKQGADNAIVSQLIRDTGMRTEAQLAAKAAAYAQRRADDYLYRFTSSSLIGRGVESGLLFPFARAQVDFLSWWTNHMFKPLTLRLSPELRARLPHAVSSVVQTVERIPLNLRAWSKFAHIAASTENDQPSWVDQAIDHFTFLPLRFGNDFLLDVSPQFGPVSSLLFDLLVDTGAIPEEVEEHFHAVFPALEFTEYDGDLPGDFLNRWLPNTRRSLRAFTVGMLRAGYGLAGTDIHSDPGLMGQIANIIAENKLPAATGDFQAALAADLLRTDVWNLVPGSEEWDAAIRDIAVDGAVEANKREWRQDLLNRTAPLAGGDREYRAMEAFEGLLADDMFRALVDTGILTSNELFEVDGTPRIVDTWGRYEDGTASPEELAWLDDRLHSAYFAAGDVEVLPGFSLMDYLHLRNPGITVNLISKNEASDIPVRSDEHAEFRRLYVNQLTGRLQNIPPGDTGREIVTDARRRGWVVSRPVEEWAQDAAEAVYKSGQRAVRGVWEWVSHRTWTQGLKKAIEDKTFTLGQREATILQTAGLEVEAGSVFTYKDFHGLLDTFDERFDVAQPVLINTLERGAVHGQLAKDPFGQRLLEQLSEADREFNKLGFESVEDWPEASKEQVRSLFSDAVDLGLTTVADYTQEIAPIFGPLHYEPPVPPPLEQLTTGIRLSGDELNDLEIIDGDTVSVLLDDGPMRIRIIGINAPEVTMDGYQEATDNLAEVIGRADELIFGIYRPEIFGLTQLSSPGERRLLAWLYIGVDGRNPVALYNPSVFTASDPRGTGVTGQRFDLLDRLAHAS